MRVLSDEKIRAAVYASHVDITLSDAIALTRAIEAAVRAELAGQEPFDADDPRFREAFDASLKSGNWPMTRLGEGYRSSITMMAFTVAYETVNRLRLYAAPVVQPDMVMVRKPRFWSKAESDAWHSALPDLHAAFDALAMAAEKE